MKIIWFIFIILMALLIIPSSASFANHTVSPIPLGATQGTVSTAGSGGHAMVKNSSGAIFVTYADYSVGSSVYKLAWSSDNGVTWVNTSFVPGAGSVASLVMPDISIDSSDIIHLVYGTNTPSIEYRNYSSAGGFGDAIVISDIITGTNFYSSTIDSQDIVHVIFDGDAPVDFALYYTNISPLTGIGPIYTISTGITPVSEMLEVDANDTVHIVYVQAGALNDQIEYVNLSSSGWGNIIQILDDSGPVNTAIQDMVIETGGTIHLLYRDFSAQTTYRNTTPALNFKLSDPPIIIQALQWSGSTMSMDSNGVLHFLETGSPAGLKYRNLSAAGLSTEIVLEPVLKSFVSVRAPRALWSINPPGNIPTSGFECIYTVRGSVGNSLVEYGIFGPDAPIPTPTNPFNVVSIELTSQLIQMVIMIGVMLLVLAAVAMLILGYLPD